MKNSEQMGSKSLIIIMMLSYALIFIDESGISVNLKTITDELHLSHALTYWIVNAYLFSFSILLLLSGKLIAQHGAKRLFCIGVFIFLCSSILCGVAGNIHTLLIGRCLQGVGASCMLPAIPVILHQHCHANAFSKVFGFVLTGANAFYALGPIIGGLICQHLGWRYFFWLNIPLALIIMFLVKRTLNNIISSQSPSQYDFIGMILFLTGISALIVVLMQGGHWGWRSIPTLMLSLIACLAIPLFFIFEKSKQHALLDMTIFRDRAILGSCVVLFISSMILTCIVFWPAWFQISLHMTPAKAGLALFPATSAFIIIPTFQGIWVAKSGTRNPLLFGLVLLCLGLAWMVLVAHQENYLLLLLGLVLFGAGIPLAIPSSIMTIMMRAPDNAKGEISGVYNTVRQLGLTIGVALFSAVIDHSHLINLTSDSTAIYSSRIVIGMLVMLVLSIAALLISYLSILEKK